MITKQKIMIFKKYMGDSDAFTRCATEEEKEILGNEDWSLINNIISDIHILNGRFSSESFNLKTESIINENVDSSETKQALYSLTEFFFNNSTQ